jgi:hypothetical protein
MPKVLRRINQVEDSPEEKRRLAYVSCPDEIKKFVSCLKKVLAQNLQAHIPAGNVFDETIEELEERKELVTFLLTIRLSEKSPAYIAEYLESGRECIAKSHLVPEYWYELKKLRSLRIQHEKINNLSLGCKERIIEEQKLAHKDAGLIDAISPVGWSTDFNFIAQALGCNSRGTDGLFPLKHLQEFSSSLIYDQFAIVPLKDFNTFLIEKEEELKTKLLTGNSECDLRIFIRYSLDSTTILLNSGYPNDYKYVVRRFGASGGLSPFVRVHHQLKYSGTSWEKSNNSANTDAILLMIAPLMKDKKSFTSRYVGMAPFGNGNSFVLEAGLSIHQKTSSIFQSSYTNVTCGGVRLPHDFWPYGKGGTLDTHCQALEAVRILIQKSYLFLNSKSVANKEVISYVTTVSSRLAVALTEVAASVHGGCINTQSVASINSNARLCFHNENDERLLHGSGGSNEDLSLLGGMFVLFGDLLRPTKYPDLLLSKPAMTRKERDGLIQAFLPLLQELGVAHELAITMSTELFTFASNEEATAIRTDLTSLQLAYTGPGIFSSLPEGGLPRFDGAIVSAGQVDLLSYAVGTPSFQAGGEGIKRTIYSSEGVLSITHATMLLSQTPPLNNEGKKISMLETLTKATLSSKQLQAGGDSSEIARKRGQQIIGEIIDKGPISFDTCFKHNGELETKCGRAPIPKDRDDTTLITILQLARQNGVKSVIVRSDENSQVVEKILTSIDTFGVGEDAVNFKSMVVTNVLKPYLVQMVGKTLAETHSIDRVKVLLVLVKCLNKPSKAILVYLNVYHPGYQLGAILRGGFNDSGVDFFVKFGLVEYLYGGGSFFNYLCGDVYKSPKTSGFGEFLTKRDDTLDYTSPSRLAAFLKKWMSSNGGLRGSVDDLLVIKVLQQLARAKENNDQDDIVRAEALLVEALAECARISEGRAEDGRRGGLRDPIVVGCRKVVENAIASGIQDDIIRAEALLVVALADCARISESKAAGGRRGGLRGGLRDPIVVGCRKVVENAIASGITDEIERAEALLVEALAECARISESKAEGGRRGGLRGGLRDPIVVGCRKVVENAIASGIQDDIIRAEALLVVALAECARISESKAAGGRRGGLRDPIVVGCRKVVENAIASGIQDDIIRAEALLVVALADCARISESKAAGGRRGGLRGGLRDPIVVGCRKVVENAIASGITDEIERAEALLVEALAECARISEGRAEGGRRGGLRGGLRDPIVVGCRKVVENAIASGIQDDIIRAEALLVVALAECARISKCKAEGGLSNRIAAIGSDVFTVTFEKGLNSIRLNVSSCGRFVYFTESDVKKLTSGFDTSSTGIKPLFEKFKSKHPWQTTIHSHLRSSPNKELNDANIRIVKVIKSKFHAEKLLMIKNGSDECEVVLDDTSTTITSSGFDAAHAAHNGFGTIVTCLFCTEKSPLKAYIADHMFKCHKDKLVVSTLQHSFEIVYADSFPVTNISSSISSSTFDSGTQLAAIVTADVSLLEQKVIDVLQAVEFHLACGQVNGAARWLQFLLTMEAMTPEMIASTYIRLASLYYSMDVFSSSRDSLIACCDFCMGKKDLLSTQIVVVNSQEDEENTIMSPDSTVISNSSSLLHRPDLSSYAIQACLMLCDVYKKTDEHQAITDLCVRAQRYIAKSTSSTSSSSMTSVDLPISLIVKYGCSQLHLKDYTNASKILAPLFLLDVKVVADLIMELGLELKAAGYWGKCLYVLRKLRNPGLASSSSTITGSSSSSAVEVKQDPFSFIVEFSNHEKQAQVLVSESVCFDAINNPQKSAWWLFQASRLLPTRLDIAENAAKHLQTIGSHFDAAALLSNEILIDSLPTPNKVVDVLLDAARFLGDPFSPNIIALDDYTKHKCRLFCQIFMEAMGVSNRHVSSHQCRLRISATKTALGEEKVNSLIDSVHKHLISIGENLMATRFISEINKHEAAMGSSILQAEVSEEKQLSQVVSSSHEKPQCTYCDERPSNMNNHLSAHHNIGKFYQCLYCEYEHYHKGTLVSHIYNNHKDETNITSKQDAHDLVYVDSYPFELRNGKRME